MSQSCDWVLTTESILRLGTGTHSCGYPHSSFSFIVLFSSNLSNASSTSGPPCQFREPRSNPPPTPRPPREQHLRRSSQSSCACSWEACRMVQPWWSGRGGVSMLAQVPSAVQVYSRANGLLTSCSVLGKSNKNLRTSNAFVLVDPTTPHFRFSSRAEDLVLFCWCYSAFTF